MNSPPPAIDNAEVIYVADLTSATATGKTRHTVDDQVVDEFAAVAIARYRNDVGVYLFYCDADWNPVTDTYHDDIDGAIAQAEYEFGPIAFVQVATKTRDDTT
jgi:hypothetical protein